MDRSNWTPYNMNHYYNPIHQEEGQHASQPEAGQTSGGAPATGASGSHPTPGQHRMDLDLNFPASAPSSSGEAMDYAMNALQPFNFENIVQDNVPNPQPDAPAPRRRAPVRQRFMAGLETYEQGAPMRDCSTSLRFSDYITDNGTMVGRGLALYDQLTEQERGRLQEAIVNRQVALLIQAGETANTKERFLDGLELYAQGARLKDCSDTLAFRSYVTADGFLHRQGLNLRNSMLPMDQERVDRALLARREFYSDWSADHETVSERFIAGLELYAQGARLKDCSDTIEYRNYACDDGTLQRAGHGLYDTLPREFQEEIDNALASRKQIYEAGLAAKGTNKERFLASLDNYAKGMPLKDCSSNMQLSKYLGDNAHIQPQGRALYRRLTSEERNRVDQAVADRGRLITQASAKDVAKFMATLEPYANGQDLQECGSQSGLKRKAAMYFTSEGGLTPKGKLLIENLPPDQKDQVSDAISKRQRLSESNTQMPESPMSESSWQQTDMAGPLQAEAMWAAAWNLTGQWGGMPSTSAEPQIDSFGPDAVGENFQHRYDSNGLMPQRAPDRLIGRGIWHNRRINIMGETYRVHLVGGGARPTNENPYGQKFMLVPYMRGG
jgi:hypothetical protein